MSRKLMIILLACAVTLGLGLGLSSRNSGLLPRPVQAASCAPILTVCPFESPSTRTSLLTVQHVENGVGPVLPGSSTTWDITANWSRPFPGCGDYSEMGSATVSWDSGLSLWVLTSSTTTANINTISLCQSGNCNSSAAGYTLYIDVNDVASTNYNLRTVDYASNGGLPNGTLCGGGSRSPINNSASATDTGGGWGGRCVYNCSYSNGPVITIYYQ